MDIRISRYTLNKKTDKENIALVDSWMADTVDKLNAYITQQNRQIRDLQEQIDKLKENNT